MSRRKLHRRFLVRLALVPVTIALIGGLTGFSGHTSVRLPQRPLPADYVEGFGEGKVLAFHYAASYVCLTTPASDLDGPYGRGDGVPESRDPKEYQLPPCFLGRTTTGSIPPFGPDGKPLSQMRKLYGIALVDNPNQPATKPQVSSAYVTNASPVTTVQTQCAQPGLPYTQYAGELGTCLMHPSIIRETVDPDPLLLPQHSHIVEGTYSPLVWWHIVGVNVYDRSIFPDLNGFCPAGRARCLTSLASLKDAQRRGLASATTPSNLFFRFSVAPESPQPTGPAPARSALTTVAPAGRRAVVLPGGLRIYCVVGRGWGAR